MKTTSDISFTSLEPFGGGRGGGGVGVGWDQGVRDRKDGKAIREGNRDADTLFLDSTR